MLSPKEKAQELVNLFIEADEDTALEAAALRKAKSNSQIAINEIFYFLSEQGVDNLQAMSDRLVEIKGEINTL